MINTETERLYLQANHFQQNEYGRYIYANRNGEHIVDLESTLEDYYSWRVSRETLVQVIPQIPIEDKKKWWQFWKVNIKPAL